MAIGCVADRRRVGTLILAMSVLVPLSSAGQTDPAFEVWSSRLRTDDRIVVTVRDQRPVAGALVALSDTALSAAAATGAAIDASITKKVPIYVRRRVGLSVSMASADRGAAVSVGAHLAF